MLPNRGGIETASSVAEGKTFPAYKEGDILLSNIRPYFKKIWFADRKGGTNGDVLVIRRQEDFSDMIEPRYLYHCLAADKFFHYNNSFSKGAKMPRGDKSAIMEYEILMPTIEEQKRIANILDRFDNLCNNLTDGLPAEIEKRQQQYEYYRDKLLSFK
jgi:type I restriction enzyme S subunit